MQYLLMEKERHALRKNLGATHDSFGSNMYQTMGEPEFHNESTSNFISGVVEKINKRSISTLI
jgi:hypothetical protein